MSFGSGTFTFGEVTTTKEKEDGKQTAHPMLRSSDADLKIILKYLDENGFSQRRELHLYSQVLASLSNFIDTTLSVDMKEKTDREIVLHDVSPEVFELGLKFLQDPLAALSISPEDVIKVVEFYDKYEFTAGIKLCDRVLFDYVKTKYIETDNKTAPINLDLLVTAATLANKCNLPKASQAAINYLTIKLNGDYNAPYNATMFTVELVEKLHEMFKNGLLDNVLPPGLTREELESPLFPKYFVAYRSREYTSHTIKTIVVEGLGVQWDGEYRLREGHIYLSKTDPSHLLAKSPLCGNNWALISKRRGSEHDLYMVCPHTSTLEVPPTTMKWEPVQLRAFDSQASIKLFYA